MQEHKSIEKFTENVNFGVIFVIFFFFLLTSLSTWCSQE